MGAVRGVPVASAHMGLTTAGLLLADVSPARMREVCGPKPSDAVLFGANQTDNTFLAHFADNVVGPLLHIIFIWVVALLASRIARVVIKRIGRQIEGATDSGRIDKIRHKTHGCAAQHRPGRHASRGVCEVPPSGSCGASPAC